LRTLQGGCKVPIAVHSEISSSNDPQTLTLWSCVTSLDAKQVVQDKISVHLSTDYAESLHKARSIGEDLGRMLFAAGAEEILAGIR
jgi:porphobilinogen deaminase